MKKVLRAMLCAALILTVVVTPMLAMAGKIVTPNGGRAILWRNSGSSGSDYVAYVSSGNTASKLPGATTKRFQVNAYGYNSKYIYGWYKGWINRAYWVD